MPTPTAPQRFLANNRNLLATASIEPSSVLPVANQIRPIATAREGTAIVTLSGTYTGVEQADYEIEILDTDVEVPRVSSPTFSGVGSGTISDITASGAQQTYTVECADAGSSTTTASVPIEGITIMATVEGESGNGTRITVDQSPLVFTESAYSLLTDLAAGQGGEASPFVGQGFDWDAAVLDNSTGLVPTTAHRIAFGDDRSQVYLSFKAYVDGQWQYRIVPALSRNVPKETPIYFVTGGRTVTVSRDLETEIYPGIATVYDLLYALRTQSALVVVDGIVANDRSPDGQASRELTLRTDAHADVSSGSGSPYARGFSNVSVAADAPTQLVTAICFAVNSGDHPAAHLGAERWKLRGSLSGDLGTIVTGEPYSEPAGLFGLTIPQRLPIGYGAPKGRFALTDIAYASQTTQAPICPVGMSLGPNVVDQTITLTYTAKPSGDCNCTGMPIPNLSGPCLGDTIEGETFMDYSAANRERLRNLYQWASELIRVHSTYAGTDPTQDPFVSQPSPSNSSTFSVFNPKPLFDVIGDWERTLKLVNDLPDASPDLKTPAETAWDTAVSEFETDLGGTSGAAQYADLEVFEALTAGDAVSTFIDNDGIEKIRKAVPRSQSFGTHRFGFVIADAAAGASPLARIYFYGSATVAGGSFTPGQTYYADATDPGAWTATAIDGITGAANLNPGYVIGVAASSTVLEISSSSSFVGALNALLSDRYRMRMQQVLITGGISPLGKSDADTIVSGDGCWRDTGSSAYWKVEGSVRGGYAPLFTNQPYFSAREGVDGAIFSTHEFALQLNVKCPQNLQIGDTVRLTISESGWGATYQPGDEIALPIIAASPLALNGGRDGSPVQNWSVRGTVDGPLAPYAFNPESPAPYVSADLGFQLNEGGIAYAKGDRYSFAIEGGHFRWRKNAGAWNDDSPPLPIPLSATLLEAGLSVGFSTGAAASFVAGDSFRFRALQPWAGSNAQRPNLPVWKWAGSAATYPAAFDGVEQLDMVAIVHDLPVGATVTLWGGADEDADDWSEPLTYRAGIMWAAIDHTAQFVRLEIASASGGSLTWAWLGVPLTTSLSGEMQMRRVYRMERPTGALQGGRYAGKASSGDIRWTESALDEADTDDLIAMLDYVKENSDEPLIVIAQVSRTGESPLERPLFARIAADDIEFPDYMGYAQDAAFERRVSTTLPLEGVWQ